MKQPMAATVATLIDVRDYIVGILDLTDKNVVLVARYDPTIVHVHSFRL